VILTNKKRLPEPIFRAILAMWGKYEEGDHGDISTTRLIKPPQIVALEKKYGSKLETDAVDCLFALQGQILHMMLQMSAPEDHQTEKRVGSMFKGWKVTGQYDLITPERTLIDYKYTNVWSYVYPKKEYEEQANVNRLLLHRNGEEIKKLENWLMFRDFSKSKAGDGKYPKEMILKIELPMWDLNATEEFIEERVKLHQVAQKCATDEILAAMLHCSEEERWFNKRAGKYNRCEDYCTAGANGLCKQFKGEG